MAEMVRMLEPSRTRPGVFHEVLLRLDGDDAVAWTCSCEDHSFAGPSKRDAPCCYHVVAALDAVGKARERQMLLAGKPGITPWLEPPTPPIAPRPIEGSLEARARAAALALLFHGDAADGDLAAELTRRADARASGDPFAAFEDAFLPDLVGQAERRAAKLAEGLAA